MGLHEPNYSRFFEHFLRLFDRLIDDLDKLVAPRSAAIVGLQFFTSAQGANPMAVITTLEIGASCTDTAAFLDVNGKVGSIGGAPVWTSSSPADATVVANAADPTGQTATVTRLTGNPVNAVVTAPSSTPGAAPIVSTAAIPLPAVAAQLPAVSATQTFTQP